MLFHIVRVVLKTPLYRPQTHYSSSNENLNKKSVSQNTYFYHCSQLLHKFLQKIKKKCNELIDIWNSRATMFVTKQSRNGVTEFYENCCVYAVHLTITIFHSDNGGPHPNFFVWCVCNVLYRRLSYSANGCIDDVWW